MADLRVSRRGVLVGAAVGDGEVDELGEHARVLAANEADLAAARERALVEAQAGARRAAVEVVVGAAATQAEVALLCVRNEGVALL